MQLSLFELDINLLHQYVTFKYLFYCVNLKHFGKDFVNYTFILSLKRTSHYKHSSDYKILEYPNRIYNSGIYTINFLSSLLKRLKLSIACRFRRLVNLESPGLVAFAFVYFKVC